MDTDLRNEIDLDIPYVSEEGKKGIKRVHISFISRAIYLEYTRLMEDSIEAVSLSNKLEKFNQEIGYDIAKKSQVVLNEKTGEIEAYDRTISDVVSDLKRVKKEYEDIAARANELLLSIPKKQFGLIQHILKRNGIHDTEMESFDWWQECVDMTDLVLFIRSACTKDDEKVLSKKKVETE